MSANKQPNFINTLNTLPVRTAVANTASDGSGTIGTIVTAGASGTRIDAVVVTNSQLTAAASSAMVYKLFVSDAAGANYRILMEIAVATKTRSTTVIGATTTFTFGGGLFLKSGQLLGGAQSVYAGAQDQSDWVPYQSGDY